MTLATERLAPSQRSSLLASLGSVTGPDWLLSQADDLLLYAYDGSVDQALPDAVVFPDTTAQVQAVVQIARQHGVPVVPRGAGTGLSGGAIARCGGIVVSTSRMNRILEVDIRNRRAVVEPGVVNADLSTHTKNFGFYYAPDPSSQKACTIGGNIATNAGGPHTLLYGVTTNHVLGIEFVTMDGTLVTTSGLADEPGYDITGLICGSEGTLGIVTKATVQLLRSPAAVKTLLASFDSVASCSAAVSGIVAAGVVWLCVEVQVLWLCARHWNSRVGRAVEPHECGDYELSSPWLRGRKKRMDCSTTILRRARRTPNDSNLFANPGMQHCRPFSRAFNALRTT